MDHEAVLSCLRRIHARIKKGWCQDWSAHTGDGRNVSVNDPEAVSWCLTGALKLEAESELYNPVHTELIITAKGSLVAYNDRIGRTQEQVLNIIQRTINRVEERYLVLSSN